MRIKVTRIQDTGRKRIVLDGTCDLCYAWGWANNQYKVTFHLAMESGQSFNVKISDLFNIDDIKDEEDIDKYLESRSISNIFQFSKDLASVKFPDLAFYESRDEYVKAKSLSDGSVVPVLIRAMTREAGIKIALRALLYRCIEDYVSSENGLDGLKEYVASMPHRDTI